MTEHEMIEDALSEWRKLNSAKKKWAVFESVRFNWASACAVRWGTIHTNGVKELPIETIVWILYDNGRFDKTRLSHT